MTYTRMRDTTFRQALRAGFAGFMLVFGCLWAANALHAQNAGSSLGGFSSNSNEPIDIESDTLEVLDDTKIAIFSGNVIATQGKMTMRSKTLKVNYAGDQNASKVEGQKESSGNQITSIRAEGKVLIHTADDQTVTSDWAYFDVQSQTITIGGNVVLSQSESVIKGEELIIDLKTNRSRFVNRGDPSKPQRVRGLFMPAQSGKSAPDTKPAAQ